MGLVNVLNLAISSWVYDYRESLLDAEVITKLFEFRKIKLKPIIRHNPMGDTLSVHTFAAKVDHLLSYDWSQWFGLHPLGKIVYFNNRLLNPSSSCR